MNPKKTKPAAVNSGSLDDVRAASTTTRPANCSTEVAHCESCGTTFRRGVAESWKTVCVRCWRWQMARKRIKAACDFLAGV